RFYASGEEGAANRKKAFGCYQRAAEQQHPLAWVELARCHLEGDGTSVNLDAARDCATKAFSAGERERAVPCLIELMKRAPERSADAIQTVLEMESVASPAGFNDVRTYGPGVAQLQTMLARYYDQRGLFGRAARLYTQSGSQDPDVLSRHAELTAVRACETCAGAGKTQSSVACPTCSGKGSVQCGECDGRGKLLIPGSPACSTCGGSGGMVQDGRAIACGTCNGTGKGKGSVIKQSCAACVAGRVPCRACTGGRILITKDCALCRGSGSRALAESS
ncbi:MAG TPA: hypothetical protein VEQ65_12050, partial [Opitutus sp.]|nr:hypothetical protein [Opitutus sp.]